MLSVHERLAKFRQPMVFGLAAAVSRAGGILSVPIAAQVLSLEELGYYAVCVAFIQLLCQFLSLGGSVAVAKAGSESVDHAHALALRFSLVSVIAGTGILALGVFSGHRWGLLAGLVAAISALEAHQQLYQLVVRAQEREGLFLSTSVVKAFAWPASVVVYVVGVHQARVNLPIEVLLVFQLGIYTVVSLGFLAVIGAGLASRLRTGNGFRAAVLLSTPMMLHVLAQWIMSSADRVILGKMTDGETLAFYSLAYSLASIMFVVVSGMALYLPHEIMKRVERWGDPEFRFRFLRWYSAIYFALFVMLLLAYTFDYSVTNFLRYRNPEMFLVLGVVGTGFLFTGVYHVYVPFLFAAGRTRLITVQTLKASIFYGITIAPLIHFQAAIGAAVGTLCVWIYYMLSIRHHAVAYLNEEGIGDHRRLDEIGLIAAAALSCVCVAVFLWWAVAK